MEPNHAPVTVLYASQSGNAEDLSTMAVNDLKEAGIPAQNFNMMDYSVSQLESDTRLLIIASTWGEGEPPDEAADFYEELAAAESLDLKQLHYAVLALGDSYYEGFCQFGKDLDTALERYGATRLRERLDCDMDQDEQYPGWIQELAGRLAAPTQAEVV
ncbi:MAG: flavodoxin domain-containing protein [Verrucomicrobiota bacterium]